MQRKNPENHVNQTPALDENLMPGEISYRLQEWTNAAMRHSSYAIAGTLGYAAAELLGAPFAAKMVLQPIFAGSFLYLTATNYGIVNDLIGCYFNLPYFSLGHQPNQRCVIRSNKPVAVAIAWGALATDPLAMLGAAAYTVVSSLHSYKGLSIAAHVLPNLFYKTSTALIVAPVVARLLQHTVDIKKFNEELQGPNLNNYQRTRLQRWLQTDADKRNWAGNGIQNGMGFMLIPLIVILNLVDLYKNAHPESEESKGIAILIGLAMSMSVVLARMYFEKNRDSQTADNPYRLNFQGNQPSRIDDALFDLETNFHNGILKMVTPSRR